MRKNSRFVETLYDAYGQEFEVGEVFFEHHTEHQQLSIFANPVFGRMMVLDGVVQTTERDEFIYHEMLAHVPILGHGRAREVLVVGGGDGGIIRELVKHRRIERIVQVEIDAGVIETSRRYLPRHSAGAFDDPRVQLVIADGREFMQRDGDAFDVIICDSTDPIGPGESLFSAEFYSALPGRLRPGGVFVAQNGVPFHQMDELCASLRHLRARFADTHFYSAAVPSYIGGIMAFAWASDSPELREPQREVLAQRFAEAGIACRYYNPAIHLASFALPEYIVQAMRDA